MSQKNATASKQTEQQVSKYSAISTDVWTLFKKYLPTDADLSAFTDDVHVLDQKYAKEDEYRFMQKLLKVYFDELNRIKG